MYISNYLVIAYFRFPYASGYNSRTERAIGEAIVSSCRVHSFGTINSILYFCVKRPIDGHIYTICKIVTIYQVKVLKFYKHYTTHETQNLKINATLKYWIIYYASLSPFIVYGTLCIAEALKYINYIHIRASPEAMLSSNLNCMCMHIVHVHVHLQCTA